MILLTYSDDETTRKCDARCYDATGGICECICGGMNHSAGVEEAISNTLAHFDITREMLEETSIAITEMDIHSLYAEAGRPVPEYAKFPEDICDESDLGDEE